MEPQQETRRRVQGKCRGPFTHVLLGAVLCDLAKATHTGYKELSSSAQGLPALIYLEI